MAAKHVLAAGLDAGGAHTRCAILLLENACVRLIGHGEAPSHGWKKSRITDQNEVAGSIRAALEQAVLQAFSTALRCDRKVNRPPGEAAKAAAAELIGVGPSEAAVDLERYAEFARVAR